MGLAIKKMIYISISLIPARLNNLHETIETLLKQTKKPDKIFINIPINTSVLMKLLRKMKSPILTMILLKLPDQKIMGPAQNSWDL